MFDISKVLHTQNQFIKSAADKSKGLDEKKDFILRRAVVVDINRTGNKTGISNLSEPPYAVCAVILDEDQTSRRPDLSRKKTWYPPLLPMTNISIPEKGEEIFIIKEQNIKSSFGYWVGIVNNHSTVSYFGAKSWQKNTEQKFPNGDIDIAGMRKDTAIKSPRKVFAIPALDGDVIQQGRHGSYIRHSVDLLNNYTAVLEIGINHDVRRRPNYEQPTIGHSRTKTIHASQTSLSRYVGLRNLVNKNLEAYQIKTDLAIHDVGDSAKIFSLNNQAINDLIINLAEKHINISVDGATGNSIDNYLYRQVLGDRNKESLHEIIGVVKQLKELVVEIYELYKEHTHEIEGEVFNYDQTIGEDGGDVSIEFEIEDKDTEPIKEENILAEIDERFEKFDKILIKVNDKLEDTLSETQFVQ